jgi:hypothetical protein
LSVKATTSGGRLRALGPWIVALVLLAWLFHVVPASRLRDVLAHISIPAFIIITILFVVALLIADAFATWITFRRSLPDVCHDLTYRETLVIRGATYLLAIVHYGVGQGGMAYFLNRSRNVPIARAAGAVMLTMGVNALCVALCAVVGLTLGGAPTNDSLRWLVLGLACCSPIYLAVVAARPRFLAERSLLKPIFDAGLSGNLIVAASRMPHIAALVAGNILVMRVFDVTPPIDQSIALLPIVFVVATLPLSPSGLGTAQAVAVSLFAPFAAGATLDDRNAAVLAYSLAFQFGSLIVQAIIGLAFLRMATRSATISEGP